MRPALILAGLAAALGMASCRQGGDEVLDVATRMVGRGTAQSAPSADAAATPAAAELDGETRVWNFGADGERAYLAYAIPESDDSGPALHCPRGDGSVSILYWVDHRVSEEVGAPPVPTKVTLRSGKVAKTYPATATGEELYGGSQVEARIPLADPVLAEFARTGRLAFDAFGEAYEPPPAPTADVKLLLEACGG